MKKKFLSFVFILSIFSNAFAQKDLKSLANQAQTLIKEIKLEKSVLGQKLEFNEQNPTEVTLTTTEQGAKGKTDVIIYNFNLVFFDVAKIERNASKKQLIMEMKTSDGLDAVSVIKNGKPDGYTDEIAFTMDNADDARDFEKVLKDLVSVSKSKWESILNMPADYAGLTKFVEGKIKDFTNMGVTLSQNAATNADYKYRTKISTQRAEDKKSEQKDYEFAWGDLNETSLKIDISGKTVGVSAKTVDKIRYIYEVSKKSSEYNDELMLLTVSPVEAKILLTAIQKLIPFARKDQQMLLAKNTSKSLDVLKLITDFQSNTIQYTQTIVPNCLVEYNRTGVEKGKTKEEKFSFNLGDLTDFKLKVEKDMVTITANTVDKLPFVKMIEKNEFKYQKEIAFYVPDIEKSRVLLASLNGLANVCKQNIIPENFAWLTEKIKTTGVDNINQTLGLIEPTNKARWSLTANETGGKKSSEKIYEFNVYDLDVLKADYQIEKKNLAVRIKSKNNEKLIKIIADGKPTFTNEIQYLVTNAEDAKKINATMKAIASNYKLLTDGKLVTNAIIFDVNSTNIKSGSEDILATVGEILTNNATLKIKITGFTDTDGDDKKNLELSKKRASAVKDKLIKDYKIDASRLSSDGKGEGDPVAPNTTPEGKAQNRRVEFVKI
jgi:outer membrane protein OmpA-like peptidoglycan-associated protein